MMRKSVLSSHFTVHRWLLRNDLPFSPLTFPFLMVSANVDFELLSQAEPTPFENGANHD